MQNKISQKIKRGWQPKPLKPPKVDPKIESLDAIQRSAESIKHSILSTEFWVSPNGQVREWLRHNGRLAILIGIPAFVILPIITFVLWQLGVWIVMLVSIAGNLIIFPLLAFIALIVIAAVVQITKSLFK